uniref:Transposase Tnp1/En/Spm-like domain-containing protein n=1 Tax=Ananas comosus var. bracteatus TaxID=296719 RepID=A0A6V7NPY8_ANACO|nr:unnamed protein product [Ananas comosus var. bracteatus]
MEVLSCIITTLQDDEPQSNGDDLSPTLEAASSENQPTSEREHSEDNPQEQEPTNVEDNDTLEIIDEQYNLKKKRGVTRAKDVWTLPSGQRIKVEWNKFGQPIKKGGRILGGWLGTVARRGNMCPIHYISWKVMPLVPFKVDIIKMTRSKFFLSPDDKVEAWVLKSVSRKWKDYKHELKIKYKKATRTQGEIASDIPPEIEKQHDREPGRIEFFVVTHKTKDGEYINQSSSDFAEDLMGDLAKKTTTSEFSNATKQIEESVFRDKKGEDRYGRVRGYGIGPTPTQVFGIQAHLRNVENESHDPMKDEVQRLQVQMQDMQKKHESEMNEIKSLLHRLVTQSVNLGTETSGTPSP